jgi:hypothetical protein
MSKINTPPVEGGRHSNLKDVGDEEVKNAVNTFLKESLPAHKIPPVLMVLKEFPRLPNGKVHRVGLPKPKVREMTWGPRITRCQRVAAVILHSKYRKM